MTIKQQFVDACNEVANQIESGDLKIGSVSHANSLGEPNDAMGWVAAYAGVNPREATELFATLDVSPSFVFLPNDRHQDEAVSKNLKMTAKLVEFDI